jgi:hypothetical protein
MITNRPYSESNDDPVYFFLGREVERTPAFGKLTLFVVGVRKVETIESQLQSTKAECLYFGANQSFVPTQEYADLIYYFLNQGIVCTLDFDVAHVDWVASQGLCGHPGFVPMISVKLPALTRLGRNATIKIDDIDFAATNKGVWCHNLDSLTVSSAFTDWSAYRSDQIL